MAGGWEARVSLLDSGFAGLGRCGGGGDLKCGGEGIGGGGYATTGAGETAAAAAAAGFNLGRRSWRGPLTEIGEEVELGLGVELAGPFVFSFYHVAAFFHFYYRWIRTFSWRT